MTGAVLLARVVLAAVFGVAAVAKLLDRSGARRSAADFGVPDRFSGLVGILLPVAELVVAVLLVSPVAARWSGAAAAGLLALFVAAIARALTRGRQPDCHCFGQLSSAQIGRGTIARNLVLAAVAVFIALAGRQHGIDDEWSGLSHTGQVAVAAVLASMAYAAAQVWFTRQLLAQNGRLLLRIEALERAPAQIPTGMVQGLSQGDAAPAFSLPSSEGMAVTLGSLLGRGRPLLLVFSHAGCGACEMLMPEVVRWQHEHADSLTVAVIARGDREGNATFLDMGIEELLLEEDRNVTLAYQVSAAPAAVVIDTEGAVASPVVLGREAVRRLWQQQLADTAAAGITHRPGGDGVIVVHPPAAMPSQPVGVPPTGSAAVLPARPILLGRPAPVVRATNALGETLSLSEIARDRFVAAFFCAGGDPASREVANELAILGDVFSPALGFVISMSRSDPHLLELLGSRRDVYHAAGKETASSFGADELPAAILIAPTGLIASDLHVGADRVAHLLAHSLDRALMSQTLVTAPGPRSATPGPVGTRG